MNGLGSCNQQVYSATDQLSADDAVDYIGSNDLENDGDTTLLSDTSTLQGDSNRLVYTDKCAELECTVESLKNKLVSKEKELTDLQLKQWSSDYLNGQLRSTICRLERQVNQLEKENSRLKTVMVTNRVNI